MNKDLIQQNGLELSDYYSYILYEWATGTGKSLLGIKIIEKFGGNWNIVLAEVNHELNWIKEFKEYGKEHLLKQVKFFCYASLHKYVEGENYIFDEAHHLCSDRRLNLLSQIHLYKLKKVIMLSATLTRTQKLLIKNMIGDYHTYKISLSEAIDNGLLPEPTVYFIGVELDNTKKYCKFSFNKDKYMMCTELEMYKRMSDRVDWLKEKYMLERVNFDKTRWLNYANRRKQFLSDCKTKHARVLLEKLRDKRLICFTGSIPQSESLSNGLSIHSKLNKTTRISLLEDFNIGKVNRLFCTGMLREGQNLANIQAGIIIQLDNTERYFTQVHGRTLRSSYPEQYVLYVKNTQDETYVKTAIENFNKDYIKFVELNDLKL